ncbi:MAG: fatty acid desaturase family protein [Acidobacteriota bacterium]
MNIESHYWANHTEALKQELKEMLPVDELRRLHQRRAGLHFLVMLRQFVLLGVCSWVLWNVRTPWVWIPVALVQGWTIFNFSILLHEVLHDLVFQKRRPGWKRLLGLLYAFPSGMSATQFTTWHLDHHAELGSSTEDPKRFHLSPKVNKRWIKLLYFTPALFPIYFRAARRETATYPPEVQRQIAWQRTPTIVAHLLILAALCWVGGFYPAARVYIIPYFFVFPIAFAINRLGQHYDVDPSDPAQWGTLVAGHWFWDFAYLWSNYHLEHHYFPGVPFYNLPRLQRLLQPFYARHGMRPRGYAQLIYGYLVANNAPHTRWEDVAAHHASNEKIADV